ncbi:MAG: Dabb family protein [Burkholderia contaminans]|uniref:Dabb family protein n=1 Tax=Burkholderia contaminans TaxID=488447 RepID=A0AAP4R2B6_9BURK|nr:MULTISPECIES: Dabb family protein [Burkholderia]MBD1410329.1 Dabb family protein [Burkholderia contaminans]MBH9666201.1 Dabb family protein [Burkholderia contaminans]MBH9674249.1 Dabb family protein [Burkholderia contaminans]MBH9704295.1 Dabb family protein [Burkholderia contaminans]MBH9719246.1 Dabb family protein [Burkholderia contaminans]
MRHDTAQVFVSADCDAGAIEHALRAAAHARAGTKRVALARNLDGSWGAGDYTLDVLRDESAADGTADFAALARLPGIERIDGARCRAIGGGLRESALRDGVWRTLMLRARPQAGTARIAALERELLQMPAFMPGIRNWRLSRIEPPGAWTHVWQQEFAHVGDLLGEYLMHPYHWGWVDRRFDAESPDWTVDAISHAFCPLASSLLADTAA